MSFLRHEEIYRSDVAKRLGGNDLRGLPALIGCDEFPAGYSLVGLLSSRACLRFAGCQRFSARASAAQEFFIQRQLPP